MVEGARLEIVWAVMSRRFESSRFRHLGMKKLLIIILGIATMVGAAAVFYFYFRDDTMDRFDVSKIPVIKLSTKDEFNIEKGVWNKDVTVSVQDELEEKKVKVKTRGGSSYRVAEEYNAPYPYKIKFSEEVSVFGFPKHEEYILLPNFIDSTSVRQFFFFNLASLMLPEAELRAKYVELEINGEYKGLYLFVESIDEKRLGLNLENQEDFIVELEMQKQDTEVYATETRKSEAFSIRQTLDTKTGEKRHVTFELTYPEKLSMVPRKHSDFIVSTMKNAYDALEEKKPLSEIPIDVDSFVSYFLFQEIVYNQGYGTSSVYYYYKDGKLHAGPLWDFDRLGMTWSSEGFLKESHCDNTVYRALLEYPEFREKIQSKFLEFYNDLAPRLNNALILLEHNSLLKEAYNKNEALYHRLSRTDLSEEGFVGNKNIEELKTFEEQVSYFRKFYFEGYTAKKFWDDGSETKFPARINWIKEHLEDWR